MKSSLHTLLLGAGFGVAFLLGQCFPGQYFPGAADGRPLGDAVDPWAPSIGANTLGAQGRGGAIPQPPAPIPTPAPAADDPIVYTEEHSGSASTNGFLAVTGSYGVGTSVMYLVDTVNQQLAVYEARGGSAEQRRIVLIGARRLDLDLQLRGYNDRSEYEYDDLESLFANRRSKGGKAKIDEAKAARSKK